MPSALDGIRVLDFGRIQQGPFAGVLLSDMGADVIKIEEPGGEARMGSDERGFSGMYEANNRGKRSITVNLRDDAGRDVIRRLIPSTDVVLENFRPGRMEQWGIGYEDLKPIREDLIFASASGWGRKGPWGTRGGYDHVAQAFSGVMSEQGGGPGHTPQALIGGFADSIGAMMLAYGIVTALVARERTGVGQHVDCSLIGAMLSLQQRPLTIFFGTGVQVGFEHRRSATYTHYECRDGKYVAIAANTQAMWERFCDAIGKPEWKADGRFAGPFDRARDKDALVAELEELFLARDRDEWTELLAAHDVPYGPVLDYAELSEHPQFLENGYVQDIDHPVFGRMKTVGPPIQMSATPPRIQGAPPQVGQHTEEIMLDLGFSWPEILALRDRGAV
ncbi:MAG: CoA transferase [Chloroflexi bacterium]|nr:CoA transferase [Chloroflexota bacterium]